MELGRYFWLVIGQTRSVKCTSRCGEWWECLDRGGGLMLRWWLAENSVVWQLARSPLLAWQAHFHRYLNNNNLMTLSATVFSGLASLQQL